MTSMSNLSPDLVEEILCRVPITSIGAVKSTCKRWNALSTDKSFTKKHCGKVAKETMVIYDFRACLMSVNIRGINNHKDLVDPFIKQIGKLNQVEMSKVLHCCDGLLLCHTKDDPRLVVWNPYLGQTRWIQPPKDYHHTAEHYVHVLGYDSNNNYKILRFLYWFLDSEYEIYDFKYNSWRVLDVTTDRQIIRWRGVSLKGNTYFIAQERLEELGMEEFLLCYDFTSERFGMRLPLPFQSYYMRKDSVVLSTIREEKLAVLFKRCDAYEMQIWITTKIEPNAVSWSNFFKVDLKFEIETVRGSFLVDEEEKAAVVFDINTQNRTNYKAYMIRENGDNREVDLGGCQRRPHVCSYVPSRVQIQ